MLSESKAETEKPKEVVVELTDAERIKQLEATVQQLHEMMRQIPNVTAQMVVDVMGQVEAKKLELAPKSSPTGPAGTGWIGDVLKAIGGLTGKVGEESPSEFKAFQKEITSGWMLVVRAAMKKSLRDLGLQVTEHVTVKE